MTNKESRIAAAIRDEYTEKKKTKLNELIELDRQVKRPAEVFAYSFGTIGALVLGTGMCFAMKVIGNMMPLGVAIGLIGIGMVTVNYWLYQRLLQKGKQKYGKEILALSEEILHQ